MNARLDRHARAGDAGKAKAAYKTYWELAPNGSGAGYAREQAEQL